MTALMSSILPALARIRRQQPGAVEGDESDYNTGAYQVAPQNPTATSVDQVSTDAGFSTNHSNVQPDTQPRIMRRGTEPVAIPPQTGFDQAMRVGGPQPPAPQQQAPMSNQRVMRAQAPAQGYEDIPQPPPAVQIRQPNLAPRPQLDPEHGGEGDSRLSDAWEVGKEGLRRGGLMGLIGGMVGGLINPKAGHKLRYQHQVADWERQAKPEIEATNAQNKAAMEQGQAANISYDNQMNRGKLLDMRISRDERTADRRTAEEDRQRTIGNTEAQRRHQVAKDAVDFAAETGTTVDPNAVKGDTAFQQYAGKQISKQQRDQIIHLTDEEGQYTYNKQSKELEQIPGVGGRERVKRGPSADTLTNHALADKGKFEDMKQVQLPKARARVIELKQMRDAVASGKDEGTIPGLSAEAQAILSKLSGSSKEDKAARLDAEIGKAQSDADNLERAMHVHLADMKTKYGSRPGFVDVMDTGGDYPSVSVSPDLADQDSTSGSSSSKGKKRTGLLDIPTQRVKR